MIALLAAAAAVTAPTPDTFNVYRFPEADSCATWTNNRKNRSSQLLEGWVLGFVSGYNVLTRGGSIASDVTAQGLLGWIDQYCAASPLDSVTTASFKLIRELENRAR